MRHTILAIAIGLSLAACGDQASNAPESSQNKTPVKSVESAAVASVDQSQSDELNEWFEHHYEMELMMSPMSLTSLGRKDRYGEIDDMSEAAEITQLEWKRNSVIEMKDGFEYSELNDIYGSTSIRLPKKVQNFVVVVIYLIK